MRNSTESTLRQSSGIGVAVCSKDALFSEGLASLLERDGGFSAPVHEHKLVATFTAARDHDIRVIVIDAAGLTADELELLPGVRALGAYKLLALTGKAESNLNVDRVLERGTTSQKLFQAIQELGHQATGLVRERRTSYNNLLHLTKREYDVAQLIARGFSNRKISQTLELQEQSVKNLVSVIMRKLNCENRVHVALMLVPDHKLSRSEEA